MRSHRVPSLAGYLTPTESAWSGVKEEQVELIGTPLVMQPTEYIRKKWEGKAYGETKGLKVASVHDGHTLAVRMRWQLAADGVHSEEMGREGVWRDEGAESCQRA